ncbi:MAG: hypothetical protein ACLPYS_07795 [Vulcanimicrobiaceae bacterium]
MTASTSFWEHIRARMTAVASMDRDMRVTFVLGALILLLAMAIDVAHGHLGPAVPLLGGALPLGIVVAYVLGQYLVFTLLFKGLLQIPRRARKIALALAAACIFVVPTLEGLHFQDFLFIVPVAALWYYARSKEQFSSAEALVPAAVASAGLSLAFAITALTGQGALLYDLSASAGLLTIVGLFVASTDIAEMVQVGGDALAERATSSSPLVAAASVCAAALVAALVGRVAVGSFEQSAFVEGLAVVLAFALVFWMLMSVGKKRGLAVRAHLPYRILLAVLVAFGVSLNAALVVHAGRHLLEPQTHGIFSFAEVAAAVTLLAIFFVAGLLSVGRRSIACFLFFGYGSIVAIFWLMGFDAQGSELVTAPFGVALASPMVLAVAALWPKTRERFRAVCRLVISLNLAIAAYVLVAIVFLAGPERFPENSLPQVLIIIMAIGWDMLTSGEITNAHSARCPRDARISFYIAYVSLIALLVMVSSASGIVVFSAVHAVGPAAFNSKTFVGYGLLLFGAPLLLLLFAVRMRSVLAAEPEPRGLSMPQRTVSATPAS